MRLNRLDDRKRMVWHHVHQMHAEFEGLFGLNVDMVTVYSNIQHRHKYIVSHVVNSQKQIQSFEGEKKVSFFMSLILYSSYTNF